MECFRKDSLGLRKCGDVQRRQAISYKDLGFEDLMLMLNFRPLKAPLRTPVQVPDFRQNSNQKTADGPRIREFFLLYGRKLPRKETNGAGDSSGIGEGTSILTHPPPGPPFFWRRMNTSYKQAILILLNFSIQ